MKAQDIYRLLGQNKINYQIVHHPPVFTSNEADRYVKPYNFARTKNLFLRTNNHQDYYLYVLLEHNRFNEKQFRHAVGSSRLSFASPDELRQVVGIEPGSVSPLNLLNEQQHQVPLVISRSVLTANQYIGIHPNINTETVILKTADLLDLLKKQGIKVQIITD